MQRPLPQEWQGILMRNVPYYVCLSEDLQQQLHGMVNVFLKEKYFEGCAGLEITDEIRVTIAGQACLLMLGREPMFYPGLTSILVYPSAYIGREDGLTHGGILSGGVTGIMRGGPQIRLGQTSTRGSLILAWDSVLHGAKDMGDGHNVVIHEFAHQLDGQTGGIEGAPPLPTSERYTAWARVLGREYESLIRDLEQHRRTWLNPYGATNPAEFFAVVTEFYFERPLQMKAQHPELFEQLKNFYVFDPSQLDPDCMGRHR